VNSLVFRLDDSLFLAGAKSELAFLESVGNGLVSPVKYLNPSFVCFIAWVRSHHGILANMRKQGDQRLI